MPNSSPLLINIKGNWTDELNARRALHQNTSPSPFADYFYRQHNGSPCEYREQNVFFFYCSFSFFLPPHPISLFPNPLLQNCRTMCPVLQIALNNVQVSFNVIYQRKMYKIILHMKLKNDLVQTVQKIAIILVTPEIFNLRKFNPLKK